MQWWYIFTSKPYASGTSRKIYLLLRMPSVLVVGVEGSSNWNIILVYTFMWTLFPILKSHCQKACFKFNLDIGKMKHHSQLVQ